MTETNQTVKLIAPNGQTVSVAESKRDARLASGYRLPKRQRKSGSSAGLSVGPVADADQ